MKKSPRRGKQQQTKTITLSSSSQCTIIKNSRSTKDFEFKVSISADQAQREYFVYALSNVEMNSWISAIESAIYDCQTLAFDGE